MWNVSMNEYMKMSFGCLKNPMSVQTFYSHHFDKNKAKEILQKLFEDFPDAEDDIRVWLHKNKNLTIDINKVIDDFYK